MFGLGTILPVKTALKLVASEIQKQLKFPIEKFDMIYRASDKDLSFKVKGEIYGFDDSTIGSAIEGIAKQQIENDSRLDFIVCHYDEQNLDGNFADIYFRDTRGNKCTTKYKF